MYIDELFKKTEKELMAIKKEDLVKVITSNAWANNNKNERIKQLESERDVLKAPYDQAKQIMIGATGIEVEKDEYSGRLKIESVDLCFLIGVLISKYKN